MSDLDDERYRLFERSAIIEFDGGAPREVAEFEAIRQERPELLHQGVRTLAQYELWRARQKGAK